MHFYLSSQYTRVSLMVRTKQIREVHSDSQIRGLWTRCLQEGLACEWKNEAGHFLLVCSSNKSNEWLKGWFQEQNQDQSGQHEIPMFLHGRYPTKHSIHREALKCWWKQVASFAFGNGVGKCCSISANLNCCTTFPSIALKSLVPS